MNWPVDLKKYNDKIKKYILNAVETGEIIRTKGKGVSGKFTVPGLKVKKKKRKNKLGKAFDEVGKVKILYKALVHSSMRYKGCAFLLSLNPLKTLTLRRISTLCLTLI